ncbi:MAG TPA: DUF371 domain-containing protein [Candidatus Nanoarchaeia archaeon]|nr:DUF371 domain-containing protein [Candidatus Nanoarchaeia archaeon]
MRYKFHAYGHPNILATHKTTLEFTKDSELSLKGDCIVGVKADFKLSELKKFIKKLGNKKIEISIETLDHKFKEIIEAELNTIFSDEKEIVIRKTEFGSERTLAIRSNKAAFELKRELIDYLKETKHRIIIILKND